MMQLMVLCYAADNGDIAIQPSLRAMFAGINERISKD